VVVAVVTRPSKVTSLREAEMTVELVSLTRDELEKRRAELLAGVADPADLRRRAAAHAITPDERDVLIELEEVEFLLGDDA
jgi:hypothetical protein